MKRSRKPWLRILVNAGILNEGVCVSFEEFRNIRPANGNYRIEKHQKNYRSMVVLYNTDSTQSERIPKFWGYCDGTKVYCGFIQHPFVLKTWSKASF